MLNNYAHIFDLLIRLRQAVDHPFLVLYSSSNRAATLARTALDAKADAAALVTQRAVDDSAGVCGICHDAAEDAVLTGCGHLFCRECIREFLDNATAAAQEASTTLAAPVCPSCTESLTVDLQAPAIEFEDDEEGVVDDAVEDGDAASTPGKRGRPKGRRGKALPKSESTASSAAVVEAHRAPKLGYGVRFTKQSIVNRLPAERVGAGFRYVIHAVWQSYHTPSLSWGERRIGNSHRYVQNAVVVDMRWGGQSALLATFGPTVTEYVTWLRDADPAQKSRHCWRSCTWQSRRSQA